MTKRKYEHQNEVTNRLRMMSSPYPVMIICFPAFWTHIQAAFLALQAAFLRRFHTGHFFDLTVCHLRVIGPLSSHANVTYPATLS